MEAILTRSDGPARTLEEDTNASVAAVLQTRPDALWKQLSDKTCCDHIRDCTLRHRLTAWSVRKSDDGFDMRVLFL
jgi:hypothetical protein